MSALNKEVAAHRHGYLIEENVLAITCGLGGEFLEHALAIDAMLGTELTPKLHADCVV